MNSADRIRRRQTAGSPQPATLCNGRGRFIAAFKGDAFPPQELIIGGLKAETAYSVSVAAYTTKGDGAHSRSKLVQTLGTGEHEPSVDALELIFQ